MPLEAKLRTEVYNKKKKCFTAVAHSYNGKSHCNENDAAILLFAWHNDLGRIRATKFVNRQAYGEGL